MTMQRYLKPLQITALALAVLIGLGGVVGAVPVTAGEPAVPAVIGPDAVFPLPGSALLDLGRQCPPFSPQVNVGSASCVAQLMQQAGQALRLSTSTASRVTSSPASRPVGSP
jgi:hypothetical protein